MKLRQSLSFSVFVYEIVRLVILLVLATSLQTISLLSPSLMAYLLAPQLLFAFMALFIWIDEPKYRPYLPLYVTGKIVTLWAGLLWVVASFQSIVKAVVLYTGNAGEPLILAFTVLIPLEIVTIISMGFKLKRSAEDK